MRTPLQFALDFFTGGDPEPRLEPLPNANSPDPLTSAVRDGYTHPTANRHAQLQGFAVSYRFERSRRRSIGFVIGAEGLVVRAPSWVTMREIDAAVQEKGAWIVAKLQQFRQRQAEHQQEAIDWTHGADIPYLGGTVRLCVLERGALPPLASDMTQELRLSLPPGASAQQVREAAEIVAKSLSLFAPYTAEDMWQKLGYEPGVALAGLPDADLSLLVESSVVAIVQVDGKLRDKFEVAVDITEDELRAKAMSSDAVLRAIGEKTVVNTIVRAPKLVNIATK